MPLEYNARSLAEAWAAFQQIPFLELGIESRADWIANGVLYAPVGFLTASLLRQIFRTLPYVLILVFAGAFATLLALGVEFTQLFFPPRTVSLNDILAECIGSFAGLLVALRYADWFSVLSKSLMTDSARFKARLLDGYVVVYFAIAFFPFDILLSWPELLSKVHSSSWGWWVAGNSPRAWVLTLQFMAEIILTAPLGWLLTRVSRRRYSNYLQVAIAGLLLGCFIEVAQFFVASGISQGVSVFSRMIGLCLGFALFNQQHRVSVRQVALMLRHLAFPIGVAYSVALMGINGWFAPNWHGFDGAATQWHKTSLMPFYYHYFTTEAKALFSLVAVCFSYAPVAVLAWAYGRSPRFAGCLSLAIATCVEAGKLFLSRPHPDPTNILLAGATGWLILGLIDRLLIQDADPPAMAVDVAAVTIRQRPQSSGKFQVWLVVSFVAVGLWSAVFPVFPAVVSLVLAISAATVWYRPALVFLVVPAALPIFDLAPWSGRFFLDEFDALLFIGLAVAYVRAPALPRARGRSDQLFMAAGVLLAFSFAMGVVRGVLPFQWPDVNSFNNYFSPYNALRIAKGALWALLIYRLSKRFETGNTDVRRLFCWGMVLGLAFTVAVILWERVAFSGLWNFTEGYRVTGPFSAMHTGGAYIECFIAVAAPFLIFLTIERRRWFIRLAGLTLLLATTYALMVTFSRNGYAAFAVGIVVVLLSAIVSSKRLIRTVLVLAALVGLLLAVAVPIFKGEFAQARMTTVSADLGARQEHWEDAMSIRDPGWDTKFLGMGLGRYPATNYWRGTQLSRSGTYQLETDSDNTFLRLGSGNSIYIEQLASVKPGRKYVVKLDVRPNTPNAVITIPICEKWLLTSYNCNWQSVDLGKEFGAWRTIERSIVTSELSISPWYSQRPIKFSLYNPGPKSTVDVDNVRLEAEDGVNLLRNGGFVNGLDHWFFSADSHLQWHVKSLFYGVLFDQGWLGLTALCLFLALALARAARKCMQGDGTGGASLAALSSFLVVGLLDTLIDNPRFLMLLLLLAWVCLGRTAPSSHSILKTQNYEREENFRARFKTSVKKGRGSAIDHT